VQDVANLLFVLDNFSQINSTCYFRKSYNLSHIFCKFLASSLDQSCSMLSTAGWRCLQTSSV